MATICQKTASLLCDTKTTLSIPDPEHVPRGDAGKQMWKQSSGEKHVKKLWCLTTTLHISTCTKPERSCIARHGGTFQNRILIGPIIVCRLRKNCGQPGRSQDAFEEPSPSQTGARSGTVCVWGGKKSTSRWYVPVRSFSCKCSAVNASSLPSPGGMLPEHNSNPYVIMGARHQELFCEEIEARIF